jgi:hypothetical protein
MNMQNSSMRGCAVALLAELCYKGDTRGDLRDFLSSTVKAYRENLKPAKKAASGWNKQEDLVSRIESQ